MAVEVDIKMLGDQTFVRKIRAMQRRAIDPRPVLEDIGEDLRMMVAEQFATEGARGGRKWDDLKPDTIRKRGSAHPILIDSGEMFAEFMSPKAYKVTGDSVEVEIPAGVRQKGESAQFGFHARDGSFIEPRPILEITAFDRHEFRRKITNFLVRGERRMRRLGL